MRDTCRGAVTAQRPTGWKGSDLPVSRHEEREVVDCFVGEIDPRVGDLLDIANPSERVVFRRHWQLTCLPSTIQATWPSTDTSCDVVVFLDKVRCRDNYFLPAGGLSELSADCRGALPDVAQQHTLGVDVCKQWEESPRVLALCAPADPYFTTYHGECRHRPRVSSCSIP